MKSILWLVLLAVVLGGCRRSEPIGPIFPAPHELAGVPFRIKTIRQQEFYNNPLAYDQDFTTAYRYDSLGRVVFIENVWRNENREYQYQGDKLAKRLTYHRGTLTLRETFEYDAQGKLTRLVQSDSKPHYVHTFRYNTEGRIDEVRIEALNFSYVRVSRYVWKAGNVVERNEFDGAGKPQSEWAFEYDSALNPHALSPADPDVPTSRNNVVRSTLTRDYTGLIDPIANPVLVQLTNTPEGLPRQKRYNYSGRTETFEYEARR